MICGWEGNCRSGVTLAMRCVTDSVVHPPTGSMAWEMEMSTLPSVASLTFYTSHYVLLRQEKGQHCRSGGKVRSVSGEWCRDFVSRYASCSQPQLVPGSRQSARPTLRLRSVSTTRVHGPSSRADLTPVYTTPVSTTRVDGPSWWVSKMHPSSRAVNSARELGPWTRVVETDLYLPSCKDSPPFVPYLERGISIKSINQQDFINMFSKTDKCSLSLVVRTYQTKR